MVVRTDRLSHQGRGTALRPLVGLDRAVSEAVEERRHKVRCSLAPGGTRRNSGFASAVMAAVPEAVEEDRMRDSPANPPTSATAGRGARGR